MKDTTIETGDAEITTESQISRSWANIWEGAEFRRMFECPLILILVAILGAMSVGFGAWGSTFQTAIVMVSAMAALSSIMAVAPMRVIYIISGISLVIDLLVVLL